MEASPGKDQVGTGEFSNQTARPAVDSHGGVSARQAAPQPDVQNNNSSMTSSGEVAAIRMRCPTCRKLYSVESRFLISGSNTDVGQEPPLFDCVACQSRFSVKRPLAPHAQIAETYLYDPELELIDELSMESAQGQVAAEPVQSEPAQESEPSPQAGLSQMVRSVGNPAPMVETRECPKCGTSNPKSTDECVRCGVLFAKYNPLSTDRKAVDFQTMGKPELVNIWAQIIEDYDNEALHDQFVIACQQAGCLPFASHKYARILSAAPREEMATKMRNRVLALASQSSEARRAKPSKFRMPSLSSIAILLGALVTTLGVMLPNMQNLTGIGVSLFALSVGMRFFLRQPD